MKLTWCFFLFFFLFGSDCKGFPASAALAHRRFAVILRQLLGFAASAHSCMTVAERLSLQDVRNMYLTGQGVW